VFDYLTVMVDQLARLPRQLEGGDQGVHNYVVHKGLVPCARLVANREAPVLTVGLMVESEAAELLGQRAEAVKVVHQYDRHPKLSDMLTSTSARRQEHTSCAPTDPDVSSASGT
jgi:hypothetical protein